ncbi:extracellular protein 6 [Aureobasidium subglaciale]|nr:extracellular protein 6 [Aureobasidium subglaciale]
MKSVIAISFATFGYAWASPILARQSSSCTYISNTTALPCGATAYIDYTVKSGDTLTTIAANPDLKSGVCDIAKVNCISNINLVVPGDVLKIPSFCTQPDNTSCQQPVSASNNTCVKGVPARYTVRGGDYLSKIADDFEITLAALEQANSQISNPDLIYPGQVINIPVCEGSSCIVAPYQIKKGDLYYDLAQTYHTTVGQIEAYNPNVDPLNITIGITIQLPQNCN